VYFLVIFGVLGLSARAEELCRNMPGDFNVYGDEVLLSNARATVEEVQLFEVKVHIKHEHM
jgi:hypothetical protein